VAAIGTVESILRSQSFLQDTLLVTQVRGPGEQEFHHGQTKTMPRKCYPEQVIAMLRSIYLTLRNGGTNIASLQKGTGLKRPYPVSRSARRISLVFVAALIGIACKGRRSEDLGPGNAIRGGQNIARCIKQGTEWTAQH